MSFEIKKIVNRVKELDGKTFNKIPVALVDAEKRIALIREELELEKKNKKPDETTIQILNSRLIVAIRQYEDEKKKIIPSN